MRKTRISLITFITSIAFCCTVYPQNRPAREVSMEAQGQTRDSDLPILEITSDSLAIGGEKKVRACMKIYEPGIFQDNRHDSANDCAIHCLIEYQGFSGRFQKKKNFDITFIDPSAHKIDTAILGLPAESEWILKAEYTDATLIKNQLAYCLSRSIADYAPRTRAVEVVFNSRRLGYYTLTEKVKRDVNRVNISKPSKGDSLGSAITGGYILEINPRFKPSKWVSKYSPVNNPQNHRQVEFIPVYPSSDNISEAQYSYIKAFVDSFETCLNDSDYLNLNGGYTRYIDLNTFIDFQLINELFANFDAYSRSTYFYKHNIEDGGKLCIGPVWDFDRSTGAYRQNSLAEWVWKNPHPDWAFPFWWNKLWNDEQYRQKLCNRWFALRDRQFHSDTIISTIDSLAVETSLAYQRNQVIWEFQSEKPQAEEIQELKQFLLDRANWIDSELSKHRKH